MKSRSQLLLGSLCVILVAFPSLVFSKGVLVSGQRSEAELLKEIHHKRDDELALKKLLPIVVSPFKPSVHEQILLTQLRDAKTNTQDFRLAADKIAELLVSKVIDCLATHEIVLASPVDKFEGKVLADKPELLSIMRSGDALLPVFMKHFPEASVSKILVQRHEETAKPHFQYMKLSPQLQSGHTVIITEPMIATGGSLAMVISRIIEKGVKQENILIASICVAPEGALSLQTKFPKLRLVLIALDEKLNEKKYIVPGLGDFGDRYFGTEGI